MLKSMVWMMIQATPIMINYRFQTITTLDSKASKACFNWIWVCWPIRSSVLTKQPEQWACTRACWLSICDSTSQYKYSACVFDARGQYVGSVGFSALLGLMVWVCQQVLHSRRAIAAGVHICIVDGIFVAFWRVQALPIPVWGVVYCVNRFVRPWIIHSQRIRMFGV